MPYIKQKDRPTMDKVVDAMVEAGVQANGDLNYILYKFCKYHVPASYNSYKNYRGELRETADWIGEIFLKPYEIQKEIENGTI